MPPISPPANEDISTQMAFGKILDALATRTSALADRIITTSPDVTVSTNLGPWVNWRGLFALTDQADAFHDEKVASVQKWAFSAKGQHSIPRSKVTERHAGWGRGSRTVKSLLTKCVTLRSLLRNRTAKRVLRSTSDATFILPCARSKIIRSPSQSPNVSRVLT